MGFIGIMGKIEATSLGFRVYVGGCPIFFVPKTTLSPSFRGPFAGFRPQHFLEMRNKAYPILFTCPVFDRFVECLEVLLGCYMVRGPK